MYTKNFTTELSKLMDELDYDFFNYDSIEKNEDEYRVDILIPGLSKEDLKILATKNDITITIDEETKKKSKFIRFKNKKYTLPKNVDINKIVAKVENGICSITIPKDKEKTGHREIVIV